MPTIFIVERYTLNKVRKKRKPNIEKRRRNPNMDRTNANENLATPSRNRNVRVMKKRGDMQHRADTYMDYSLLFVVIFLLAFGLVM